METNIDRNFCEKLDYNISLKPMINGNSFKEVFMYNHDIFRIFFKDVMGADLPLKSVVEIVTDKELINKESETDSAFNLHLILSDSIFIKTNFDKDTSNNFYYLLSICKNYKYYDMNLDDDVKSMSRLYDKSTITCTVYKHPENYFEIYKKGGKSKDVIWLSALCATTFTELYDLVSQVLNGDKLNRFMNAVISMSDNKYAFHKIEENKLPQRSKEEIENYKEPKCNVVMRNVPALSVLNPLNIKIYIND